MGCGRVGSELSHALVRPATTSPSSTRRPRRSTAIRPGARAKTVVGLGFDRDVLEEAGIKEADAFIAVSRAGTTPTSCRRAWRCEHYHVPKVIARIYDPRRAEIYERLNIPTVATTTWGVKQIQLMLLHDRQEIRETPRGRRPAPDARPGPGAPGRQARDLAQRRRARSCRGGLAGRQGVRPRRRQSTLQEGDYLIVMMAQGRHGDLDACSRLRRSTTDEGRRDGRRRGRAAPGGRPGRARPRGHADRTGPRDRRRRCGRRSPR